MKRLFGISSFLIVALSFTAYSILVQETAVARSVERPSVELWRQVEIIRTAHGVPHIRAENLRAAGYALAWLQSEDYGARTAMNVMENRGELAKLLGPVSGQRNNIESDFLALP